MFCRNCGEKLADNAEVCIKCGVGVGKGNKYCHNCGTETNENQDMCIKCGVSLINNKKSGSISSKFKRSREGKILGGVCSGLEKYNGINKWLVRILMLLIPLWPFVLAGYIIVCVVTEMD